MTRNGGPDPDLGPRRRDVWGLVRDLAREGTTVLLTTQYLEEADQLADRIAVIDRGRLITEGTAAELKDRTAAAIVELEIPASHRGVAVSALETLGATVSTGSDRILLPAPAGPLTLRHTLRLLDEAGVAATDVALHRPTLDDVFLALTCHHETRHG